MDNLFREFCHYYITNQESKLIKKLKKTDSKKFKKYKVKAQIFITNIESSLKDFGYSLEFSSFCNLLTEYISKKEKLTNKEKRKYLEILKPLSEFYEINLKERLANNNSNNNIKRKSVTEKKLFNKFCKYNLSPNNDVEEYNNLKKICKINDLSFKDIQKKSIIHIEELKTNAEHLGFDIEIDSIDYIIKQYNLNKKNMSDYDKSRYLKLLLQLSKIYELDLRKLLYSNQEQITQITTIDINELLRNISNPLDNDKLLSSLLYQRYNNGYFEVRDINLDNEKNISSINYEFQKLQSELTFKLYRIFIEKYNNYATDDLNENYINMISENDIQRLNEITENELYEIIKLLSNRESPQFIINQYNLTLNLYLFIEKSINETTDIKVDHIGIRNKTLFNVDNSQYTIKIYLNGSEENTHKLLNKYIISCVQENINYDMKGIGYNSNSQEKTILYANINDITKKISILENILNEDSNLKQSFFSPIHSSGRINNSLYGISHSGVINKELICIKSYNDYFNDICEVSYYRVLSKIITDIIENKTDKNIVENFIRLSNVSFTKSKIKSAELAYYNGVSFNQIKDLINQYIPLISSTLNIYINNTEKHEKLLKEFKKSIRYVSNICQGRDKKTPSNIVINEYLEQFINNN